MSSTEVTQLPATLDELFAGVTLSESDPAEVGARIAARLLAAPTIDDALALSLDATHARDIVGKRITITGVQWLASEYGDDDEGEGLPFFAVFSATTSGGEDITVTCGAVNVVVILRRAELEGSFPLDVKVAEAPKATRKGYRPLWLRPADAF